VGDVFPKMILLNRGGERSIFLEKGRGNSTGDSMGRGKDEGARPFKEEEGGGNSLRGTWKETNLCCTKRGREGHNAGESPR